METISFIGSGNVATHLAKAFFARGCRIVNIYSRTPEHAQRLAEFVQAAVVNDLKALAAADVYIVAVDDNAVATVVTNMPDTKNMVLHTAGAVSMDVLGRFDNHGVLYPLQTFRLERDMNMKAVPFFIEANTQNNVDIVRRLAFALSDTVREAASPTRAQLHLAAVFASNFVNALITEAATIAGNDFETLKPLVRTTVERALTVSHPREVQTGPAHRGDTITMEKHLQLLAGQPELQEIYRLLSKLITHNS